MAADRVWENVEHIFCEIDPFCQEVLKKHWPNSKIHDDIKTFKGHEADIVTGGFPCQPFSVAGSQKGKDDNRFLWPEMLRVIKESKPTWVIGENVAGIVNMALEQVCTDLEAEGYEVQPIIIPACAVNASHRRERVWILGHAKHTRRYGAKDRQGNRTRTNSHPTREKEVEQLERPGLSKDWFEVAAEVCRVDDAVPTRLDRNPRLKALGNAIVPQVAEEIMKAIRVS